MRRGSSSATYSRCCTNSTDWPKYGLRCSPDRNPSTTSRAWSSSRDIREMASGCKNLLESRVTRQLTFLRGGFLDQPLDHLVGRNAFAFGRKVGDDAVPHDGRRQCRNVFGRDIAAPVKQRAGLAPQKQILHGPGTGAPAQPVVDKLGDAPFADPRLTNKCQGIFHDVTAGRDLPHDALQIEHLLTREHLFDVISDQSRRPPGDLELFPEAR